MKLALAQVIELIEKGRLVSRNHDVLLFLPQLREYELGLKLGK
jgi:hypothetical protein